MFVLLVLCFLCTMLLHSFFGVHTISLEFISANALFPSSSHNGVPYLSHKLLLYSSSVSFRHSVCQSHSMNYGNSNLAGVLSLSCPHCHPLWHGWEAEGMEEMMRRGDLAVLVQKEIIRGSLLYTFRSIMAAAYLTKILLCILRPKCQQAAVMFYFFFFINPVLVS